MANCITEPRAVSRPGETNRRFLGGRLLSSILANDGGGGEMVGVGVGGGDVIVAVTVRLRGVSVSMVSLISTPGFNNALKEGDLRTGSFPNLW